MRKSPVIIRYVRPLNGVGHIDNIGGITLACQIDYDAGTVSAAVATAKDINFNRKSGTDEAMKKFAAGDVITTTYQKDEPLIDHFFHYDRKTMRDMGMPSTAREEMRRIAATHMQLSQKQMMLERAYLAGLADGSHTNPDA